MQTPHDSFKDAQHALLNFVDMHSWAFETAAKVLSLLAFGPNYLSQLKTTMVRFHLGVEKHIDRNVSPNGLPKATAKLTVLSLDFMPHAELVGAHPADYSLASLTAEYHTTTEQIGRYWVSRGAPPPDGVVQLAFTINDSQPLVHSIAERRPRAGHPPIESPMVRAALEDLLTMCMASANTDLPFRCTSTPIAVPGRYCSPTAAADAMAVVSARGTGTKTGTRSGARASVKRQPLEWVPLFEDWKAYLSGRTSFRERLVALEGLSTGHTPEQLIQMLLDFEQQPSYSEPFCLMFVRIVRAHADIS